MLQVELQDVSNLLNINTLLRDILLGGKSVLLALGGFTYCRLFKMHLLMCLFQTYQK
jgi:hypothetical protein